MNGQLGIPFFILIAASLTSWPWMMLGIPGSIGVLTPPGIALLVITVIMAMHALRKRLPLSLISWPPVGQGALLLLTTGFIPRGDTSGASSIAVIAAYAFIFLFVVIMSTDLAKHGVYLSISFVSLFILTQTTRFPIFEVSSAVSISNPSFATLLAFLRCLVELSLIIWLLRKLVEAERTDGPRVALGLVLLTAAHGVLASWEVPLLRGNLSLGTATEQALQWMILIGIQYGIVTGLAKMRQAWSRIDLPETESGINQSSDIGTMGSDKAAAFKIQEKTNVRRRPRKKPNRDRR